MYYLIDKPSNVTSSSYKITCNTRDVMNSKYPQLTLTNTHIPCINQSVTVIYNRIKKSVAKGGKLAEIQTNMRYCVNKRIPGRSRNNTST